MILNHNIEKAILFSFKTHEIYQKQKRKGKDVPYIVHPLMVGMTLARVGADDDTIVAGILHDTIEDSIPEKKVSWEMLAERFGENVANIVKSVSEMNKELSWEERKEQAVEAVKSYSHSELLVKSADIVSNGSELIYDYKQVEEEVFSRFNAPREKILRHYLIMIRTIVEKWRENPLYHDLVVVAIGIQNIIGRNFMIKNPAGMIYCNDYDKEMVLECPVCGWKGKADDGGMDLFRGLFDVSCPICDKMLLIVSYTPLESDSDQ